MKRRLTALILAACLLAVSAMACAEGSLLDGADAPSRTLNGTEKRGITLQPVTDNPVEEGISPVTGRVLSELTVPKGFAGQAATGRYLPVLAQISNSGSGIMARAPWGLTYADVVYEYPLYRKGDTRLTAVFSDLVPDAVGPIRSARIGNVWLREEWDGAFIFFGQQEYERTNVTAEFRKLGTNQKDILFSGMANRYGRYYTRMPHVAEPNNVSAAAAALLAQADPNFTPESVHVWKFTDEPLQGDSGVRITVISGDENREYDQSIRWDPKKGQYFRYLYDFKNNWNEEVWADKNSGAPIGFDNVIIQHTQVDFVAYDAPVMQLVDEGNADFFMNGKHVAGYWKREDMHARTVYYDADGNEIAMQRGRTYILILPRNMNTFYASYK